ncbi:8408_t:CDS:2 [Entrophospora sp. SA101]|nr:18883_t:CDS:2 [Entrophospora sp. SA101]CAJ0859649.1 8408_t:CDS:2 [Entrophospora sp. SA101]
MSLQRQQEKGWVHHYDKLRKIGLEFAVNNWTKIRDTDNMKQVMACGNMTWIEHLMDETYSIRNYKK